MRVYTSSLLIPGMYLFLLLYGCGSKTNGSSDSTGGTTGVTTAQSFVIEMPVRSEDTSNVFLGIWPFAVHGGSGPGGHLYDGGHPGWDVEFKAGTSVRAAADGTIQSVSTDSSGKKTIQIQHTVGGKSYRTNYTNIENPVVIAGDSIKAGSPLGAAGRVEGFIGPTKVTYYMTHFQLDDFNFTPADDGKSNKNSVSPEPFLTTQGIGIFQNVWTVSAYPQELTEPFPSPPRSVLNPFPIKRSWTLQSSPSGGIVFPHRIEFIYVDPAVDSSPQNIHDYAFYNATGTVTESGSVTLQPKASPFSTIDLQPQDGSGNNSGQKKIGVYDILETTLKIDWGTTTRPASLSNSALYTTQK